MTSSLFGRVDPLAALDLGQRLALSQSRGFGRELALGVSELVRRLRSRFEHVEVTGRTSGGHGTETRSGSCLGSGMMSIPETDLSVW